MPIATSLFHRICFAHQEEWRTPSPVQYGLPYARLHEPDVLDGFTFNREELNNRMGFTRAIPHSKPRKVTIETTVPYWGLDLWWAVLTGGLMGPTRIGATEAYTVNFPIDPFPSLWLTVAADWGPQIHEYEGCIINKTEMVIEPGKEVVARFELLVNSFSAESSVNTLEVLEAVEIPDQEFPDWVHFQHLQGDQTAGFYLDLQENAVSPFSVSANCGRITLTWDNKFLERAETTDGTISYVRKSKGPEVSIKVSQVTWQTSFDPVEFDWMACHQERTALKGKLRFAGREIGSGSGVHNELVWYFPNLIIQEIKYSQKGDSLVIPEAVITAGVPAIENDAVNPIVGLMGPPNPDGDLTEFVNTPAHITARNKQSLPVVIP